MANIATWNVICCGEVIGTVEESTEASARCAALCKFGITDEELAELATEGRREAPKRAILPNQVFDVIRV